MCAEQLYLTLMELDADADGNGEEELEELLLETEWLKLDPSIPADGERPAQEVVRLLLARLDNAGWRSG